MTLHTADGNLSELLLASEVVLAWDHEFGVVELSVLDLAFDPHELRIPKGEPHGGEWVHSPLAGDKPGKGIHRYVVPSHSRLIQTRGIKDPADHKFWKAHPVSPENVIKYYDMADEGTREQGRAWYPEIHKLAGSYIAPGHPEEGGILLSTYSPQTSWPINMMNAARSADRGYGIGPGEGVMATKDQAAKANRAIAGEGVNKLMTTAKTHSFGVLIAQGDDSPDDPYGHVVVDVHAVNIAAGGDIRGNKGGYGAAPIGDARQHEYVADQYREAARRISEREGKLMKPYELQAITWLVQQRISQAEDATIAGSADKKTRGAARGRIAGTRKAWQRWVAYAKERNIPLQVGVSAPPPGLLASQIAYAEMIELASDGSLWAQLLSGDVRTVDDVELAYDPKEPRDPATGEWVTFYHGTTDEAARKIEKQGLRPSTRALTDLTITTDPEDAAYVAASRVRGWPKLKPAMVKITIPAGLVDQYVSPHGNMPSAALASMVPPHYLSVEYDRIPEHVRRNVGLPPRQADLATSCPGCGCLTAQLLEPPPFTGSGLATELAAWEHERRGPDGRWIRGISTQILDPYYNELPESGLRGTVRSKGTFGGQGGRDLEDAARIKAYRREHPVQPNPITAAEARGDSRPVSMDEYQALAAQGLNRLGQLSQKTGHGGLTRHWDAIKEKTYPKVLEPWGGATIDSKTGVPLEDGVDAYAITVKPAGMEHVSIPEGASEAQFNAAMDQALARFGAELDRKQRYLGVFHDDENHRIDIDPVLVVNTLAEVEQIGSYTRAVGGAYRFSDGNGYWPPHVAEGAALAADDQQVHFEGPGQWRSQAAEAQDGLSPEQQAEIDDAADED